MTHPLSSTLPLPVSWQECKLRGWSTLDVLLVTGDAYIDHPSFGVAVIGRLLEKAGYKVAILSQPRYDTADDFKSFPTPQLFCGITAGNLDSIVANYTGNGKVRDTDSYSEKGNPWRGDSQVKTERRRPDRASLIYTSLAKSAFKGVPIVLGGIEASLRRFVHYDYKQNKLRSSFLTDAKADLIVYGMGEKAILTVASHCSEKMRLNGITGTCERLTDRELHELYPEIDTSVKKSRQCLILPSLEEITADKKYFLDAEIDIDRHARAYSRRIVLQRQQTHWVVQHPASNPLLPEELDALYQLPYTRLPHPKHLDIPAFRMIKDSVTIVRGCSGNCSFCAITRHQGPRIVSRTPQSVYEECQEISRMDTFSGTISDLGGPTANLFGTTCAIGSCKKHDCLYPKLCPNLQIDEKLFLKLLKDVSGIKGVSHLFISSGLRMELLLQTPKLLEKIISDHTPGSLKIAPEHTEDDVLCLMHKEPHELLQRFIKKCREVGRGRKKNVELTPYIITSHPGSTVGHAKALAVSLQKLGLKVRKFQDFTPTPGTISTAMYVTGLSPDSKKPIPVPRNSAERKKQRSILEETFQKGSHNHFRPHQKKKRSK